MALALLFGGLLYWQWDNIAIQGLNSGPDQADNKKALEQARSKAEADAGVIEDLRRKLGQTASSGGSKSSTPPDLSSKLKAAEDAARQSQATVAKLQVQLETLEAKYKQELAAIGKPADPAIKKEPAAPADDITKLQQEFLERSKDAQDRIDKLKAGLKEAEVKSRKDAQTLEVVRKRLDTLSAKADKYAFIDAHALAAPEEAEKTVPSLAEYLVSGAIDERELARAIFRWTAEKISYDYDAYAKKTRVPTDPPTVLKLRKTVCQGYSLLFEALCKHAGLEVKCIVGYASGNAGKVQEDTGDDNHMWNAVKIYGQWTLVDATWAGGYKKEAQWRDYFFQAPPEGLIFDHFPKDANWQLLEPAVTSDQFDAMKRLPRRKLAALGLLDKNTLQAIQRDKSIAASYQILLDNSLVIQALGFAKTDELLDMVKDKGFQGFPKQFGLKQLNLKIVTVPLQMHLKSQSPQVFRIESPDIVRLEIKNANKITVFQHNGDTFECQLKVQPGPLVVQAIMNTSKGEYHLLLEYVVD
ncbi:MAG TPA: transglutaminase domain-containing protein [Gemmataceae bacterium]|nr:transglutaminase domain-containing protein [Gemmataceae bacterium]